jgi:hypothetical protein
VSRFAPLTSVSEAPGAGVVAASSVGVESVVSSVDRVLVICGRVGSRERAEKVLSRR